LILNDWFARWQIPAGAQAELRAGLVDATPAHTLPLVSEAGVLAVVKLEASQKGMRLFRNNVGGMYNDSRQFVRFGLANESERMSKTFKSGDLIGIEPVLIRPEHLGQTIGRFVSREVKAPNWHYTGNEREAAQLNWAQLIIGLGGNAGFATGPGTL
jgi:hypothetical protein